MKNNKFNTLVLNGTLKLTVRTTLSNNSYANLFNVINKGEKSYFNLCKNINFKNLDYLSTDLYSTYEVNNLDTWTGISYKMYQTYELWWLICKFNKIKNPFTELEEGKVLKIPSKELVEVILNTIKNN